MTHAGKFSHLLLFLLLIVYQGKREQAMLKKLQFCFVKHSDNLKKSELKITVLCIFNHLNLDGIKVCKIIYSDLFQGLGKYIPVIYF